MDEGSHVALLKLQGMANSINNRTDMLDFSLPLLLVVLGGVCYIIDMGNSYLWLYPGSHLPYLVPESAKNT